MSFLVNDNGPATATNLPANSITAAMIAANAATTAKFASKSATFIKFASDAKAALIGPAAAALATLLAETAANRAGFVGGFYLADDFETDSLATKTNSTYDAASDYYGNPPFATTSSAAAEWTGATGDFTFTGDDVDANVNVRAMRSVDTFTGDFEFTYTHGTGSTNERIGVYEIAEDGTFNQNESSGAMKSMTHSWEFENGQTFYYGGATTANITDVAASSTIRFERVSGVVTVYDVDNADAVLHTFAAVRNNEVRIVIGTGNQVGTSWINFSWTVPAPPASQTLAPTPVTLATANPTDLIAFVVIDPQEAITVGTDIAMSMSVDGGTTDAIGSWTSLGYIGGANLELYAVEADVSAQTGSSLTYEITTANNKEIRLHQLVGIKAFY